MTNFQMVREFMLAFGHSAPESYTELTMEELDLRLRLIEEELRETEEAMLENEPVNIAKELTDLLYVVYGTAAAYGINIDKCFEAVHKSNMSKLDADGKPRYREDGKILKGDLYKPADLTDIVK